MLSRYRKGSRLRCPPCALAEISLGVAAAKPFSRQDHFNEGGNQKSYEDLWKAKYASVANSLGLEFDVSCTDVSRAFYWPSCKPGAEKMAEKVEGELLDLNEFAVQGDEAIVPRVDDEAIVRRVESSIRKACSSDSFMFQGFDLRVWAAQYGTTFEIEDALRASSDLPSDFFGAKRDSGGVHIQCPFENEHSEPGGTGTFVINASENEDHGFSVFCSHSSCKTQRGKGASVDRLLFVRKMLEDRWLTLDDLANPEFGGGPISPRVYHENRRKPQRSDLRVVDKDGKGIDVALFHNSMIAKPGLFDFARLNELCGTQIEPDVTAEQMAEFIESGRVTVAHLIECGTVEEDER